MALQTQNLSMLALEVLNHQPVRPEYPVLKDGIHLRWNSGKQFSFPWYGYYLFRRRHQNYKLSSCLRNSWIKIGGINHPFSTYSAGLLPYEYLVCEHGVFLSNERIRLTREFQYQASSAGDLMPEVDLVSRRFIYYTFTHKANEIAFAVGFKKNNTAFSVKIKLWDKTIHHINVKGDKGEIKTYRYAADCITSLEFPGAQAAVADICYHDLSEGADKGWHVIDGFRYACCLPVADSDYPCPSKPSNFTAAQALALGRITYGDSAKWLTISPGETTTYFRQYYNLLKQVVDGGPAGLPMYQKFSDPYETSDNTLHMQQQKPLDLILMGTLDPAVAQMTGLYFVDNSVVKDEAYDYLIVADKAGKLGKFVEDNRIGDDDSFFKLLFPGIVEGDVDGWICFNRKLKQVDDLDEPKELKAYALPGMVTRDEETGLINNPYARNSAGFTWNTGVNEDGILSPDTSLVFDMWRYDHGPSKPTIEPSENDYTQITKNPFIIIRPSEEIEANIETSSQYPPFRLLAFDNRVPDGWYSYKIAGRDIFGRYSKLSEVAAWYQWTPMPSPRPYYYLDPPANTLVYTSAIELLDATLPPPPTAIEAYALDPLDNFVVRDTAYTNWFANLGAQPWYQALNDNQKESLIGLRIRWQWTLYHIRQAPGEITFSIHYNPGYDTPANYTDPNSWSNHHLLSNNETDNYTELVVPMRDIDNTILSGTGAEVSSNTVKLPAGFNLDNIRKGFEHILLQNGNIKQLFRIDSINKPARELTLNGNPSLGTSVAWSIGLYVRQYELFLPSVDGTILENGIAGINPALAAPDNFIPDVQFPKAYANISISTVENKGTRDIEGTVGAPSKIFRVVRKKPAPPASLPPDSAKIYASPADYYGDSYYTYRWVPQPHLFTHIYRALDESIFQADYAKRPKNPADADLVIDASNDALFPKIADEPTWISVKRQAIANELNTLNAVCNSSSRDNAFNAYRNLSNDALRILAGLPHTKKAFQQLKIEPLDPDDANNANGRGPDNPDSFVIDPSLRKLIDHLSGKAKNRYFYRAAYVDGAQNISDMNLPTLPVYLPDVMPPAAPIITKIKGGDRKISIQWKTEKEENLERIFIYKTESKSDTRDIRLMGEPVADLPATVLQVNGGVIDLSLINDIVILEKVYNHLGFEFNKDWLTDQTSTNYLVAPIIDPGNTLTGITAADGTRVILVYRNAKGQLQATCTGKNESIWTDAQISSDRHYYYILITKKKTGQISIPSTTRCAKPFRLIKPAVAENLTIAFLRDSDPIKTSIKWITREPYVKCLLRKKKIRELTWTTIFQSERTSFGEMLWEYDDLTVEKEEDYEYSLRLLDEVGNATDSPVINIATF